ncbi:MAG: hypothetical protein L0H53_00505 [Candidatus Nitrosocosmicus sp.]|nr:hypothetical protein [Candidatus Nitrosocosmicus sp.]
MDQKPETAITKTVATPMSIDELDDLIRMKKGNTVLKERRRGRKPKSEIE